MLAWSIEVELHPLVADSIKSTDDQPDRYGAQAPRSQLGACLASVPAHPKPACWAGRINNQCAT